LIGQLKKLQKLFLQLNEKVIQLSKTSMEGN
jgi:hypothetical protein